MSDDADPVPELPPGVDLEDHTRAQRLTNACIAGYSKIAEHQGGRAPCTPRALLNALLVTAAMTMQGDPLDGRETFLDWANKAYDYALKVRAVYLNKEPSDA